MLSLFIILRFLNNHNWSMQSIDSTEHILVMLINIFTPFKNLIFDLSDCTILTIGNTSILDQIE